MAERSAVWFRPVWLGLLVTISAAITVVFTCVTPFAAFAVVAAALVSRRDAVMLAVALWLTNQAVGFGLLHYPWTASTFAWGAALGVAAVIGALAALWTFARLGAQPALAQSVAAFAASFALYQLTLYAVAAAWVAGVALTRRLRAWRSTRRDLVAGTARGTGGPSLAVRVDNFCRVSILAPLVRPNDGGARE